MENTISHTEIVNAPLSDVWKHLLYKIDSPQYFVPHVSDVEILEKNEMATIRKMTVALPENEITIIEKITAIPYCVKFEIVEHPTFTGFVENHAKSLNENTTQLTYSMTWYNKLNNISANNMDILKAAVNKSKNYIEDKK